MLVLLVLIPPNTCPCTRKDPDHDTTGYLYSDDMYAVVYTKQVLFPENGFVNPLQ